METFLKVALNGCLLPIILCLLFSQINCAKIHDLATPRIYDLCGQHNGRRIYLESGRSGIISASNVQLLPSLGHSVISDSVTPQECRIEFVACPSCVINWKIVKSNFTNTDCDASNDDHVELTEPPYGFDVSGRRMCSANIEGDSKTRDILVKFVFSKSYSFAFEMRIEIKRNQINLTGEPDIGVEDSNWIKSEGEEQKQLISTPFFPLLYPRDYEVEYHLQCAGECQVHVNFIDFHVAPASVLEIVDSDGEGFEIFTGLSLRPRIIISTRNSITIRFNANGGMGAGFNAVINYLGKNASAEPFWDPKTDCGGYVDRLGGAITMMKMTANESELQFFDCIWIIRPSNKYYHMKTHESLQLASFNVLENSQLTVKRGMNSKGEILGTFTELNLQSKNSFITTTTDGFYVHLRGNFSINSTLALVYSVFSYSECYLASEFLCANQKCIPVQVHCDGFDQCGDSSDEPASCPESEPYDRHWYKFNPNYYFPATEYDLQTASILFVSTSAGLIAVIACMFLILYRINIRSRHQRELRNHLQTISELLDQNNRPSEDPVDEPPIYEAPPEYEEVIKVGMEKEIRRSRRKSRDAHGRRRSKQPILDTEPEEDLGTCSYVHQHSVLTEPFPIEIATSPSEAEEIEVGEPTEDACPEYSLLDQIDHQYPQSLNSEPEDSEINPPTNGFLIVFQNDEPTAVPVHEFIPASATINTCLKCEQNLQKENKFANRLVRRFSADPLLPNPNTSLDGDMTRSFRM